MWEWWIKGIRKTRKARWMQRVSCESVCACKIHSENCVRCTCVQLVFMCMMFDHTFAHLFVTKWPENDIYVLKLFQNVLSCFRAPISVLKNLKISKIAEIWRVVDLEKLGVGSVTTSPQYVCESLFFMSSLFIYDSVV